MFIKSIILVHVSQSMLLRRNITVNDVWNSLEQNWNFFFWLTGETPFSLRNLVNRIQVKFFHKYHQLKGHKLDIKNQVS